MFSADKKLYRTVLSGLLLVLVNLNLTSAEVLTDQYFKEGKEFLHNGNYKEAIEKLKSVIAKDKRYLKAYASMGMAYLKLGDKKMAAKYFNLAKYPPPSQRDMTAKKDNWRFHFYKGEDYYRSNMFKEAIEEYKLAIKYKADFYLAYFSMGSAYRKTGDLKMAFDSWEAALEFNPKDRLIKRLMTKLVKEIDVANRIEVLERKIEKDGDNIKNRLSLARLYLDKQESAKAITQFEAVLKADPKNRDAYRGLASVKAAIGDFEYAIKILKEYLLFGKRDESLMTQLNMITSYKDIIDKNRFYKRGFKGDLNKEMVFIPEGKFYMGSDENNIETGVDEKPEHEVYVDSFFIDKYEVTNSQYKAFVKATSREHPFHWRDLSDNSHAEMIQFEDEYYPEAGDYYPISYITWYDADAFCRWTGKRLPTEAEWEKAARGSDKRRYPWGDEFDRHKANTALSHFKVPTPIGSYPEGVSPYGVYDMAGNVWEWTADWYKGYKGASLKRDSFGEKFRVVRGGSFLDPPELHLRTSERHAELSTMKHRSIGFRCAKDAERKSQLTQITLVDGF